MSWISDAFSYFKRLTLLGHEVSRLTGAVDTMKAELTEHDRRLVRIEALIEYSGYGAPPVMPPRLPR